MMAGGGTMKMYLKSLHVLTHGGKSITEGGVKTCPCVCVGVCVRVRVREMIK